MTSPMPDIPDFTLFPTSEVLAVGGWIDDLARAASEHGIMITLSFIPAADDGDEDDA